MAGINDYSNTAGSNTTINGIDISEGCSPAGINNAIRQLMADIADVDDGVVPLQTPDINGGTIDGAAISGSSTIDSSIIGGTTPAAGTFTTLTANTSATISGDLTVDTDTLYVDSSNNRVGVGTTSPSNQLEIAEVAPILRLTDTDTTATLGQELGKIEFYTNDADGVHVGADIACYSDDSLGRVNGLVFSVSQSNFADATEALRIDSSGNLLVGKTSVDSGVVGVEAKANGTLVATVDGDTVSILNRKTSDGEILRLTKDGSTVGSISCGNSGTYIYFGSSAESVGLGYGGGFVFPTNGATSGSDNSKDLGSLSFRWDDIYATNGTIQTSDQNEKQSIQLLTSSEIAVAKRISKLFKTFKWNSAVEEKGDNARTHTGIIAQDVQQAFSDEGLDAGNYGMFMSNTWWEKEISVDAVAPQEAVYETQTDEEGNEIQVLVQEAVEGKDAYTYMDTKEEATEGYTEKTRLGIRYPELLSFVSSAFEQRLTNIETRLTALEA